jgi:hypothetical protein
MSTKANEQAANDTEEQQVDDGTHEPAAEVKTYREVAAEHIDTLNEINKQIPKMLKYFATALSQLTNDPVAFESDKLESAPGTLEARREIFRANAQYFKWSVDVIRKELILQINALEKYKVIPKSHPKFTVVKRQGQTGKGEDTDIVDPQEEVKNGGYGDFDVGVLNARASSGQVGSEDVLDRAKNILEDLHRRAGMTEKDEMAVDG